LRRIDLSLFVLLLLAGRVLAMDPVEFIVRHNPDIRALREFNDSILNRLKVTARARTKFGGGILEEEAWVYDVGVIVEMPLYSKREALEMRLREYQMRRQVRREAAAAVARYRGLRRYLKREKAIIEGLKAECTWLERRVEAGLDPQKVLMRCVMDLRERIKNFEMKQEELSDALENVLSLVRPEERERLREILEEDLAAAGP